MKTFNDLKEGDYIYKLDAYSGNVDYLKVNKTFPFPQNHSMIRFDKRINICVHNNDSFKKIYEVIYFCNQKDCLDQLSILIKHCQAVSKRAKQNIQKLKEL